jgi:hypothetical protein
MSNRAYLFSTNFVPGTDATDRRIVGLAEWGNDIPIGFKLLVAGSPRKCPSLVFEEPTCAILGDYDLGVARFFEFLAHVHHPAMSYRVDEAREFLENPTNKQAYILLEPEEVFWLGVDPPAEQADRLLAELTDLRVQKQKAVAEIEARIHEETHPPGLFARLFGASTPIRHDDSNDMVVALGLGGWTNELFYDPK